MCDPARPIPNINFLIRVERFRRQVGSELYIYTVSQNTSPKF